MSYWSRRLAPAMALILACMAQCAGQIGVSAAMLVPNGGRVSWYKGTSHELIAFDAPIEAGKVASEVFTINPDRTGLMCVTCSSQIRKGFVGQPAWHPNGEYLVIQVENENSQRGFINSLLWGFDNDLWLIRRDGTQAEKIWATPFGHAALHPTFSSDGTKLMFSEGTVASDPWTGWRIRTADFNLAMPGTQKLSNLRVIAPNGAGFYEGHEFIGTDRIMYSFGPAGARIVDEIYISDRNGSNPINLTNTPGVWDEHAHASPVNPRLIAFMSSRFEGGSSSADNPSTELYVMYPGATSVRLTAFNQNPSEKFIVKDLDWDKTGRRISFLISGPRFPTPQIWILMLN